MGKTKKPSAAQAVIDSFNALPEAEQQAIMDKVNQSPAVKKAKAKVTKTTAKATAKAAPKAPKSQPTPVTIEVPSGFLTVLQWIWMPFKVIFRMFGWPLKKLVEKHVKRFMTEMQTEMDKANAESK